MEEETEAEAGAEHAAEVAAGVEDVAHGVDHGAEAATGMPQLDFTTYPNLIFWLVVAIVAVYLILTRVALPRIGTVLAERSDAISNDLEMAALHKRRAEEAEAAYNTALAQARDESHKIAAENRAAIDKELAGLMAKADAEIAAQTAESEGRIRQIQESATISVEEVARDTALEIVRTLLPSAADEQAVAAAVAERTRG